MTAALCPGKQGNVSRCVYGLCIRCDRLDPAGKMKPAARLESGVAVCVEFQPLPLSNGETAA